MELQQSWYLTLPEDNNIIRMKQGGGIDMHKTDFLFAQPGFIRGMGRALDLGSTKNVYNGSSSADEADFRALKSDWTIVGDDIRRASHQHGRKKAKREKVTL